MANTYNINSKQTIPTSWTYNNTFSNGTITTTSGSWSTTSALLTVTPGEDKKMILDEKATLEVKGKVTINGLDLEERLKTIEKVLMIPERDVTMEAKYPSLKKKYDEYIKELSKYRMWDSIKGE